MKLPPLVAAVLLAFACASCSVPTNSYSQTYVRAVGLPKLKRIPSSHVSVEEFSNQTDFNARAASLLRQGYVVAGRSRFDCGDIATDVAKNFAAREGCELVLQTRRKVGQGMTSTMMYGGYTQSSFDLVSTPQFTPSGQFYNTVTPAFSPPQPIMVPHDFPYDIYRHDVAFLTRLSNSREQQNQ